MLWAALAVAVLATAASGCASSDAASPKPVRRVLVVALPGVTWDEVRSGQVPNLERLVEQGAVGDVSTRIGRTLASTTAAYLTLGAGTRAVVPGVDTGVALNPGELHGGVPASELQLRRLGHEVDGITYIPVGATIDANADSPFAAVPGTLGDALARGGVHRAVIANADSAEGFPSDQPPPDGAYARSAATALMGTDGVVPGGSVGRELLTEDRSAPFGRRLDSSAVLQQFDAAWAAPGRSVVLVEGSDLARASAYRLRSTPEQARALRARALRQTDALLGRLLRRVDPATDAVLVVSPVAPTSLGIAVLRGPGARGGYLRSASTRRDGYVYLADVAPTVLQLVGLDAPDDIEGRPFDVAPASGDRVARLATQAQDAATRDARSPVQVPAVIAALALLLLAVVQRHRLPDRAQRMLRPATYVALGVVPGTFLAGLLPATWSNELAYYAAVVAVALGIGAAASMADRWRRGTGALVGVGSVLAVIGLDLLVGAPLQVNRVFGYSMAVAGRYTGLGNLAFALFSSAVVCLAVLVHERGGSRAMVAVVAILGVGVLLDGLPMLGADVGGSLSLVPAAVITVLALSGRRIRWRELALALIVGLLVVAVFGAIDSAGPAASKTHLARISQHASSGRFDLVATVLWRRVHASFGGDTMLLWLIAIAVVGAALAQAAAVAAGKVGPGAPKRLTTPGAVALAYGLGLLAAIGLVANDSSIAVPATMLLVIVPVLILRHLDATSPEVAP